MINPDAEVDNLRHTLLQAGYEMADAYLISDAASDDINELMLDMAANAITEATEYASQIGAEEFIEDIDIIPVGNIFQVVTRSRKTDYSEPERKMLEDLVKNGKRAADGSRYKVIPITKRERIDVPSSMFELMRDQRRQQVASRTALNQDLGISRQKARGSMKEQLRALVQNTRNSRKTFYDMNRPHTTKVGETEFRTASDKQDANNSWVRPKRELDMTGYLMDLNNKIERVLYDSVKFLVESYREEYA